MHVPQCAYMCMHASKRRRRTTTTKTRLLYNRVDMDVCVFLLLCRKCKAARCIQLQQRKLHPHARLLLIRPRRHSLGRASILLYPFLIKKTLPDTRLHISTWDGNARHGNATRAAFSSVCVCASSAERMCTMRSDSWQTNKKTTTAMTTTTTTTTERQQKSAPT